MAFQIRLGVLDLTKVEGTFPYTGFDKNSEKEVVIENQEQLWDIIASWDDSEMFEGKGWDEIETLKFHSATLDTEEGKKLIPHNLLIDSETQAIFKMYLRAKDFSFPPFPVADMDQPAWWHEAYDVITMTLQSAKEVREKQDEHKHKLQQQEQSTNTREVNK